MIFLDTNVVIGFLARNQTLRDRLEAAMEQSDDVAVSSVVAFELEYGAAFSANPERNRSGLEAFFEAVPVVPFSAGAAAAAAEVRAYLRRQGTPIGPYDLLIAGHAVAENALLITNNHREFSRVPGLRVEDWLTP